MKKSLFNLCWFVFLTFLSIVVPAYILMTGTATLLPFVTFAAGVLAGGAIGSALAISAAIFLAEKRQNVDAHKMLMQVYTGLEALPAWRNVFLIVRLSVFAALLLALSEPVAAGYAVAALVSALVVKGLVSSYVGRVTPFKVRGNRTYMDSAFIEKATVSRTNITPKDARPDI